MLFPRRRLGSHSRRRRWHKAQRKHLKQTHTVTPLNPWEPSHSFNKFMQSWLTVSYRNSQCVLLTGNHKIGSFVFQTLRMTNQGEVSYSIKKYLRGSISCWMFRRLCGFNRALCANIFLWIILYCFCTVGSAVSAHSDLSTKSHGHDKNAACCYNLQLPF